MLLSTLVTASSPAPADRHASDHASGAMSFDETEGYQPARMRVLWLENTLDCRTWSYYCDIRDAMKKYHTLCTPIRSMTCLESFDPELVVVGPRYTANLAHADETLGFDLLKYAHLPIVVMQNKMYEATTREMVGTPKLKLSWVQATGAIAAFTWLTEHREFTRLSGVPHHWMPFGVDQQLYGRFAGEMSPSVVQPFDAGFTGASSKKYPLRQAILDTLKSMSNISAYTGTWAQTSLNVKHNNSWKAPDRDGYVLSLSRAKMWVSTLGPSNIVGTRYFEVLASGTTMLLCNRPPAGEWVYDGLFEDGVHVVMFDGIDDLRDKISYYQRHEEERQTIVRAALARVLSRHTWDARARFLSKVAAAAMRSHKAGTAYYRAPPDAASLMQDASYEGCYPQTSEFAELQVRRPLRRFTVSTCLKACGKAPLFALHCGGFCTGNGHRLGQCLCGRSEIGPGRKKLGDRDCATTCSLHDSRPCGGPAGIAVFRPSQPSANRTEAGMALVPARKGRRGKSRKGMAGQVSGQKKLPRERGLGSRALGSRAERILRRAGGEAEIPLIRNLAGGVAKDRMLRIVPKDCGAGFFALVLYALNQLIWADENNYLAHVDFGPTCPDGRPNRYYDREHGPNMWTYFFRPVWENVGGGPKDLQLSNKELFNMHHMSKSSIQTYPHGVHRHLKIPKWRYDEAWHFQMRTKAYKILSKYVRIQPRVLAVAQTFYERQVVARGARPLLGLHIRGTDKIRNVGGRIVPPMEYLPLVTAFLKQRPDALIYLATDSPAFLQEMQKVHGDRLVVYEALRSNRNAFADTSLSDNYKKGEDALVEALLLSCANLLIKPASALSEFAAYFNPALHNHTIEMQYAVGHPEPADVFAAHFASPRDGLRGPARCPGVFPDVLG